MLKLKKTGRKKFLKLLHVFTMTAMILNMSMVSVFFVGAESALACAGGVTIDKVTNPAGSTQQFTFTKNFSADNGGGATASQFTLTDAATPENFNFTTAGVYEVIEDEVAGWELESIVCSPDNNSKFNAVVDLENRKVTIDIDESSNINCVFTNKELPTCGNGVIDDSEDCDLGIDLNGTTNSGCTSSCKNTCKMELTKTDFGVSVKPGDDLDYQITLKNVGQTNCTGSGVELRELYDDNTVFVSSDPSPYSSYNNYWNLGKVIPGASTTIDIEMNVKNTASCGVDILNKVCVWAKEWGSKGSSYTGENWVCANETTPVTCPTDEEATIKAYKVVCDEEKYLPNWGTSGTQTGEPSVIDANTAQTFVNNSNGKCQLEADWAFEWGWSGEAKKQTGSLIGAAPAGTGWNSFTSETSASAPAEVVITLPADKDDIWVREELKDGYVPFANPPKGLQDSFGAEIYCKGDILNYDNYDKINNMVDDATYYCVAFNAHKTCGDGVVNQDSEECDDGNDINDDACTNNCKTSECGDKIIQTGEDCDDGNTIGGDGCSATCGFEYDFGDAPDSYDTLLASNGARHKLGTALTLLTLGATVDIDADGQPSAGADGDNNDTLGDDEDGVSFTSNLERGYGASIIVNTSGAGLLNAWIDFNQDNDFDTGERVFSDESLIAGNNNLSFNVPNDAVLGDTYARFRFSTIGGLTPNGLALDGEVEDYKVEIKKRPVDPYCGDGILQTSLGEQCDDGLNGSTTCTKHCKIMGPYCGDGIINQAWEECDGTAFPAGVTGMTCTAQCQYDENKCDDKMFARFNAGGIYDVNGDGNIDGDDGVLNGSEGNMTDYVFLGSKTNIIPAGAWFYLGSSTPVVDPDIAPYEDVPGLAVQRLDGSVRAVLYGTRAGDGAGNVSITEHINGNFEFFNANVTDQRDDKSNANPGNNQLEKGFDGNGVGSYNAGNDEVWRDSNVPSKSYFWLTTTTADDGFYTDYKIIDDCAGKFTVCKYKDFGVIGDFEVATDTPLVWGMKVANSVFGYDKDYTTDASTGCYTVNGLKYGTYTVTEAPITGGNWVNSMPADHSGQQTVNVTKTGPTDDVVFLNYQALGSIEVCKYNDKNANGVYDSGDSALAWDMAIVGMRTNITVKTDATTGCVKVDNLVHGDYIITEAPVSGWQNSLPGTGVYNVTLDSSHFNVKKTFLNYQPNGSIKICKYNDLNYDGIFDIATDTPMVWDVNVKNSSGTFDKDYKTATDTGCVIVDNLEYDTYIVTEDFDPSSNWVNSKPGDYHYDLTLTPADDYKEAIFLNYQKMGRVKVCKYNDKAGNGTYDALDDSPLEWNISIKDALGVEVFTGQTASTTGCLVSDLLSYGDYTVSEATVSGWNNSTPKDVDVTIDSLDTVNVKKVTFLNYQPNGTISGHKYNDVNRNGVIDTGEAVLANVEIQLIGCPVAPLSAGELIFKNNSTINNNPPAGYSGNCVTIASTTTAIDGSYSFTGLDAGDYGVAEVTTGNWVQSFPVNDKYYYFNLGVNVATSTIDFANYINPGSITVCKKIDANGKIDESNDDLSKPDEEWEFTLSQNSSVLQTASTSLSTGCLTFNGLDEGDYTIAETLQSGYRAVDPGVSTDVTLAESENKTIEFINYKMPVACEEKIFGYKYNDWTDAGLKGWEIKLADATGATIGAQTTDENGYFEFDNLCVGQYTLTETQQFGWEQVKPGPSSIASQNYQYIVNVYGNGNNQRNFRNRPTINGCKYSDINSDGVIDSTEPKLGNWEIQLYKCVDYVAETGYDLTNLNSTLGCTLTATTTTETDSTSANFGCYEFNGLTEDSNYYVQEVNQTGWVQTYPTGIGAYEIQYGSSVAPYDFANHEEICGDGIVQDGEQCDDGNTNNNDSCRNDCTTPYCGDEVCDSDESCSTCSSDCGSCGGGGGGGGGGGSELLIINPQVTYDCLGATITWLTNKPATTRLVYDTVSHSDANTIGAPNYGYASSTEFISTKTTGHTVVLTDLIPGKAYYFRPISSASPEKIGTELVVAEMPANCCENPGEDGTCIIVKGEEGKPILEIKKENAQAFANPGDKGIEYIIRVANSGNLDAYDTVLVDTLPEGLTYSDTGETSRTWDLGDLAVGETKAVTYLVDVDPKADYKVYKNIAVASATNNAPVSDEADLEVLEIKVLAETGFDNKEFIFLTSLLISLVGASIFLKRRAV